MKGQLRRLGAWLWCYGPQCLIVVLASAALIAFIVGGLGALAAYSPSPVEP